MSENPASGQVWKHTMSGKHYMIVGIILDSSTDAPAVLYQPLYECQHTMFTRPLDEHPKAWNSANSDGTPRYVKVADNISEVDWAAIDDDAEADDGA